MPFARGHEGGAASCGSGKEVPSRGATSKRLYFKLHLIWNFKFKFINTFPSHRYLIFRSQNMHLIWPFQLMANTVVGHWWCHANSHRSKTANLTNWLWPVGMFHKMLPLIVLHLIQLFLFKQIASVRANATIINIYIENTNIY